MIIWSEPSVRFVLLAGTIALVSAVVRLWLGRRGQQAPAAAMGAYLLLLAGVLTGLALGIVPAFKAVSAVAEADKEAMLFAGMAAALGPVRLAALLAVGLVALDGLGAILGSTTQTSPQGLSRVGAVLLVLLGGLTLWGAADLIAAGATSLQLMSEGAFDDSAAGEVGSAIYRATFTGCVAALGSFLLISISLIEALGDFLEIRRGEGS